MISPRGSSGYLIHHSDRAVSITKSSNFQSSNNEEQTDPEIILAAFKRIWSLVYLIRNRGICHGMTRQAQVFYAIRLQCSKTLQKTYN